MTPEIFFTYLPVVAIVGGGYLLWRHVRSTERRKVGSGTVRELQERVTDLEEEVSSTSQDMEELKEGQSFTERLLAERHKRSDETRKS